jgi:hypothetical protein
MTMVRGAPVDEVRHQRSCKLRQGPWVLRDLLTGKGEQRGGLSPTVVKRGENRGGVWASRLTGMDRRQQWRTRCMGRDPFYR